MEAVVEGVGGVEGHVGGGGISQPLVEPKPKCGSVFAVKKISVKLTAVDQAGNPRRVQRDGPGARP